MKTYKHYKGGLYIVIAQAMHTETEEELIVYVSAKHDNNQVYARPVGMFYDYVTLENGEVVKRFSPIES